MTAAHLGTPSGRAARRRVRVRRVRTTTFVQRLGEVYERLLYVGVLTGLLVQAVRLGEAPDWAASDAATAALAQWLAILAAAAGFGILLKVLLASGRWWCDRRTRPGSSIRRSTAVSSCSRS
jgi:hypothetical protein